MASTPQRTTVNKAHLFNFPIDALKDASRHFYLKRMQWYDGMANVLWGGMLVINNLNWGASTGMGINFCLALLAAALAVAGIVMIVKQSKYGWFVSADIVGVLGIGNIIAAMSAPVRYIGPNAFYGAVSVAGAIYYMWRGSQYSALVKKVGTLGQTQPWLQAAMKAVTQSAFDARPDVVSAKVPSWDKKHVWRLFFDGRNVLFICPKKGMCEMVPAEKVAHAFAGSSGLSGKTARIRADLWGKPTDFYFESHELEKLRRWFRSRQ